MPPTDPAAGSGDRPAAPVPVTPLAIPPVSPVSPATPTTAVPAPPSAGAPVTPSDVSPAGRPNSPPAGRSPAGRSGTPAADEERGPRRSGPGPRPSGEDQAERGLRGLVGSGSSQVSVGAAMRARDAARPTAEQEAEAENMQIVRRNWTPREELPRR